MKRENPHPSSAGGPSVENGPALTKVEAVVRSLVKLIHGKKIYADNNPRLSQFRDDLRAALAQCFLLEPQIVLTVEPSAIRWENAAVYENERREESIAFLLHKDGIGEITIRSGAIEREIDQLVQILTDEYHRVVSEEDVVTRFWNADFEHISYRVLDDYLSGEYSELTGAGVEGEIIEDHEELLPSLEDKGRIIVKPGDPLESIDTYLKKLIMHGCASPDDAEREKYFQSMVGTFFNINGDELSLCQDELVREQREDTLAAFVESTLVFTLLQDNPSAVRDVAGVLERIVEFAVEEKSPATAARLLWHIRDFRKRERNPASVMELCLRFEKQLTHADVVSAVSDYLATATDTDDALAFLREAGVAAVDPLLRVLHHVDGKKLHRDICDVLAEVSANDIPHLLERMDVDNPAIATDAVYLAGKMPMPRLTQRMRELAFYPDRHVKEGVVALLARIGDPAAIEQLITMIGDEDKHVRCRAMEACADSKAEGVCEKLSAIAFQSDLAEKDIDEQEVLFKSLGRVADDSVVSELDAFVERKGLMQFGKSRENKFLAIRALEGIASDASLAILTRLTEDSNNLVASRARRSRDTLAARMEKAGVTS